MDAHPPGLRGAGYHVNLNPPTLEEVAQALSLLQPEKLLMVRKDLAELDAELKTELHDRLRNTFFPGEWASRLQSVLLLLHEAHAVDSVQFVAQVFLPWVKFRRSLQPNWQRVGREMARIRDIEEGSTEETEHQIGLYRLIVSDLFDPYLTLLVACCEFIAGTFTDIDAANFKLGEFNKVEFIEAHLRRRGDTSPMFKGYNAKVRNAISHGGSHGYEIEGRTVLFRNINRGPQPKVSTVRWSVDELGWNGILLRNSFPAWMPQPNSSGLIVCKRTAVILRACSRSSTQLHACTAGGASCRAERKPGAHLAGPDARRKKAGRGPDGNPHRAVPAAGHGAALH